MDVGTNRLQIVDDQFRTLSLDPLCGAEAPFFCVIDSEDGNDVRTAHPRRRKCLILKSLQISFVRQFLLQQDLQRESATH